MLTELQTPNLVVAGSNPVGRKTVAQWLEHAVSSIFVAVFCFEVNAGGFTGKSVMVLTMKVPGPSPGLLRQIAQFTTRRSWSPLFCFGHAGTEGSATAKNVDIAGSLGKTRYGGQVGRRARLRMQVLAPMTGLSLARVSNRRLGHRTQEPWSPY